MLIKPVAVILDRRALTFGKFKIRINPLMMKWPEIVFTNSANFTKKNCSKSAMRQLRSSTSHFSCLSQIKFTSIKTFAIYFFSKLVQTKQDQKINITQVQNNFCTYHGLECHSKRDILFVRLRVVKGCSRNLQVPVPTQCSSKLNRITESYNHLGWKRPSKIISPTSDWSPICGTYKWCLEVSDKPKPKQIIIWGGTFSCEQTWTNPSILQFLWSCWPVMNHSNDYYCSGIKQSTAFPTPTAREMFLTLNRIHFGAGKQGIMNPRRETEPPDWGKITNICRYHIQRCVITSDRR